MLETQAVLNEMASQVDPLLRECVACGKSELRMEYKVEWRPMAEACRVYGVTPGEVRASGAKIDSFGRVKAGVPYITCMACGMHVDATDDPDTDHTDGSKT